MLDLGLSFWPASRATRQALMIVDGNVRLNYAEWYRAILSVAAGLDALGLKPAMSRRCASSALPAVGRNPASTGRAVILPRFKLMDDSSTSLSGPIALNCSTRGGERFLNPAYHRRA